MSSQIFKDEPPQKILFDFLEAVCVRTNNKLNVICGKVFGVEDADGREVNIDRLMGNSYIKFSPNLHAIYIPGDEILRRTKYEWFARLSQQQLRNCDTIVAKHLLLAQE